MPNTFTLDQPFELDTLKVARMENLNYSEKTVTFYISIGAGEQLVGIAMAMQIGNGQASRLNPDMTVEMLYDASVATAFNQVTAAYFQAMATGGDADGAVLAKMADLGLIPAGTAS